MPAFVPSVGISDSYRFAAVRCQRQVGIAGILARSLSGPWQYGASVKSFLIDVIYSQKGLFLRRHIGMVVVWSLAV